MATSLLRTSYTATILVVLYSECDHENCGVGWYVWRPGGGVDGEKTGGVTAGER